MTISLHSSREALLKRLLEFLWRQWSALGVAGHARSDEPWMVDPEALLLFSTHIARHDSRLFDEILDWLHTNGSWINLQRLGNLHKQEHLGDAPVMAAIAERLAGTSSHHKWKQLARRIQPADAASTSSPRRLFPDIPPLGPQDSMFLRHGLQRGPVDLRGMSQCPQPDRPATFLFKLRALFGLQSRAEVIAWLLSNEYGHPAEIARQTGYFRRSVQLVLNDLTSSGHFGSVRVGREKTFSILREEDWRFLLTWPEAKSFPQWINWAPLFHAIQTLLEALGETGIDAKSPAFQAVKLREAFEAAKPALARAGRIYTMQTTRDSGGSAQITALLSDLESLIP